MAQQRLAFGEQAHARAGAREQAHPELVLETSDPARERWLRDVESSRRPTHVPFFRHRDERLELKERHRLVRTTRRAAEAMQKRYWTPARAHPRLARR